LRRDLVSLIDAKNSNHPVFDNLRNLVRAGDALGINENAVD
jgi:hypothetical protein